MKMRLSKVKLVFIILSLLIVSTVLAACGDTDLITPISSNTATATTAPSTTAAASTTSAPAATTAAAATTTVAAPATVTPVAAAPTAVPTQQPTATAKPQPAATVQPANIRATKWLDVLKKDPNLTIDPTLGSAEAPYVDVKGEDTAGGAALIDSIVYVDMNKDGIEEAVIPLDTTGTAGITSFLVYGAGTPTPKLLTYGQGYKLQLLLQKGQLLAINALYSDGIPNCCPNAFEYDYYALKNNKLEITSSSIEGQADYLQQKVENFYSLINSGELQKAYNLLSATYRKANAYDKWAKGFATTRSVSVKASATGRPNQVQVEITSVDATNGGGSQTHRFAGTWQLQWDTNSSDFFLNEADIKAQAASTAPQTSGIVLDVFKPIFQNLHDFAGVPVFLPTYIGGVFDTDPVYSSLARASSYGYQVELSTTPDCNGAGACTFGYISGDKPSAGTLELKGTPYKLANNITGYYVAGHCGSSCAYSTMTWKLGDAIYTIAINGAGPDIMVKMANSALTNGSVYNTK